MGGGERKCKKAKLKYEGFVDGSLKWGQEGNGNCGRVVIMESGVSKSSWHRPKNCGSL